LGALSLLSGGTAHAQAPNHVGWWTAASTNTPTTVAVPVGADVPAGGMLVQSGSDAATPTAYGALSYDVPETAIVDKLVLTVAGTTGTTPSSALAVCPLKVEDFVAEQGGPLASGPSFDCARQVVASPSADGTTYTFAVGPLRSGTSLAVAIVPAAAVGRVVLAPPGAESLVITDTGPTPTFTEDPTFAPAPGTTDPSSAPVPGLGSTSLPPLAPAAGQQPDVAGPSGPSVAATAAPTAPATDQVAVAAGSSRPAGHTRELLALLLVVATLAAWAAASHSAGRAPLPTDPAGDAPPVE
jgi:hypothetical protein